MISPVIWWAKQYLWGVQTPITLHLRPLFVASQWRLGYMELLVEGMGVHMNPRLQSWLPYCSMVAQELPNIEAFLGWRGAWEIVRCQLILRRSWHSKQGVLTRSVAVPNLDATSMDDARRLLSHMHNITLIWGWADAASPAHPFCISTLGSLLFSLWCLVRRSSLPTCLLADKIILCGGGGKITMCGWWMVGMCRCWLGVGRVVILWINSPPILSDCEIPMQWQWW